MNEDLAVAIYLLIDINTRIIKITVRIVKPFEKEKKTTKLLNFSCRYTEKC